MAPPSSSPSAIITAIITALLVLLVAIAGAEVADDPANDAFELMDSNADNIIELNEFDDAFEDSPSELTTMLVDHLANDAFELMDSNADNIIELNEFDDALEDSPSELTTMLVDHLLSSNESPNDPCKDLCHEDCHQCAGSCDPENGGSPGSQQCQQCVESNDCRACADCYGAPNCETPPEECSSAHFAAMADGHTDGCCGCQFGEDSCPSHCHVVPHCAPYLSCSNICPPSTNGCEQEGQGCTLADQSEGQCAWEAATPIILVQHLVCKPREDDPCEDLCHEDCHQCAGSCDPENGGSPGSQQCQQCVESNDCRACADCHGAPNCAEIPMECSSAHFAAMADGHTDGCCGCQFGEDSCPSHCHVVPHCAVLLTCEEICPPGDDDDDQDPVLSDVLTCPGESPLTSPCSLTSADYMRIHDTVVGVMDSLDSTCESNNCPVADFAGCVLRLAGHDFMDGSADGCVDFADPDNAGLISCINHGFDAPSEDDDDQFEVSLHTAWEAHCAEVSLADFVLIAAEAVMARQATDPATVLAGFAADFDFGRTTKVGDACRSANADKLLPNPEESCSDVERVFLGEAHIGLDNWRQTVALMGVHTLGKAKRENSGYDGWWADKDNVSKFNNNYFHSIVAKGWIPERAIGGNPSKNQWRRSDAHDPSHKQMMLNTDMCLFYDHHSFSEGGGGGGGDANQKVRENLNAATHDCCAWAVGNALGGDTSECEGSQFMCCAGVTVDCEGEAMEHFTGTQGPTTDENNEAALAILEFATDEAAWLLTFREAWDIATRSTGTCTTSSNNADTSNNGSDSNGTSSDNAGTSDNGSGSNGAGGSSPASDGGERGRRLGGVALPISKTNLRRGMPLNHPLVRDSPEGKKRPCPFAAFFSTK